eukprot:m.213852 g.213852  ORF g.213852 m.213852 type:complete len:92 (-) comp18613_c4_seq5:272-547(-)
MTPDAGVFVGDDAGLMSSPSAPNPYVPLTLLENDIIESKHAEDPPHTHTHDTRTLARSLVAQSTLRNNSRLFPWTHPRCVTFYDPALLVDP